MPNGIDDFVEVMELSREDLISLVNKQTLTSFHFELDCIKDGIRDWKSPTGHMYTEDSYDSENYIRQNWLVSEGKVSFYKKGSKEENRTKFAIADQYDDDAGSETIVEYIGIKNRFCSYINQICGPIYYRRFDPKIAGLSDDCKSLEVVYIEVKGGGVLRIAEDEFEYNENTKRFVHKQARHIRYFVFLKDEEYELFKK